MLRWKLGLSKEDAGWKELLESKIPVFDDGRAFLNHAG
jgi:hypothetical protein